MIILSLNGFEDSAILVVSYVTYARPLYIIHVFKFEAAEGVKL